LADSDSEEVLALFSDSRVLEFYDMDVFTRKEEALAWIQKHRMRFDVGDGIRWAIRYKGQRPLLGTCGFNNLAGQGHSGEIGYEISPANWGNGVATEAVRAIIDWAFLNGFNHPLRRIVARIMLGNEASARLLKKVGFQDEGIMKRAGHWKGASHDLRIFTLPSNGGNGGAQPVNC